MRTKELRVFHGLVNYGTQAGLFARALREAGVEAISVAFPDPFKRHIDVELLHGGNLFQKVIKHTWNRIRFVLWFFKYNTFHFYFGSSLFPNQFDLPLYKFFGKKVIMEYLGYDVQLYQLSVDKYSITNIKSYKSLDEHIIADSQKIKRLKRETKFVDLQLVCAPCYSEFVKDAQVLPLAIDISRIPFCPRVLNGSKIEIMHAPTHRGNKGTTFIVAAVDKLIHEGFNVNLTIVENISHDKLQDRYKECDLFIDQVLSGWYGTASIEAMAVGRPTVCFLREEYFQYIDYGHKIPIINASPESLCDVLRAIIDDPLRLKNLGIQSRQFVEEVHDVKVLTKKLVGLYASLHSD